MNPHYKETQKVVGSNNADRFNEGDQVFHWFAGRGEVIRKEGKSTVIVDWNHPTGRANGKAWAKHLKKI